MKYEEIKKIDSSNLLSELGSLDEDKKLNALLHLVLNENNYNLAMKTTLEFSDNESELIKGCAIECFGHIARIYGKLELEKVNNIINTNLRQKPSKFLLGKILDAKDDIEIFIK